MSDNRISKEQLLQDHYFHEADRMNQRTDWFLIFHAILMEAFFTINQGDADSILVVGLLGFLLSCLWLISGIRATRMAWQLSELIKEEKGEAQEMHEIIFKKREETINKNRWYGWSKFLPLFGIVIPFIFLIAWILLLLTRTKWNWFVLVLALIIGLIVLGLIRSAVRWIESNVSKN